ncbi:hypothetical protein [Photobacterium galatheae]|nr:hypothetical protein [Photobacterium galatheae]MCM0149025.1 hypothetical protein [Photobacterium galatheae]
MKKIKLKEITTNPFVLTLYAMFWGVYLVVFSVIFLIHFATGGTETLRDVVRIGVFVGMFGFVIYSITSYFLFSKRLVVAAMKIGGDDQNINHP